VALNFLNFEKTDQVLPYLNREILQYLMKMEADEYGWRGRQKREGVDLKEPESQ